MVERIPELKISRGSKGSPSKDSEPGTACTTPTPAGTEARVMRIAGGTPLHSTVRTPSRLGSSGGGGRAGSRPSPLQHTPASMQRKRSLVGKTAGLSPIFEGGDSGVKAAVAASRGQAWQEWRGLEPPLEYVEWKERMLTIAKATLGGELPRQRSTVA